MTPKMAQNEKTQIILHRFANHTIITLAHTLITTTQISMNKHIAATLACIIFITTAASGSRHKTISSENGLSNSAILSLHQDDLGHIYIGTADGLNIWNGSSLSTFKAANGYNYFHGNLIWHIYGSTGDNIYLNTKYGLAYLDPKTREVDFYSEFAFYKRIAIDADDNVFAMDPNNNLYYFNLKSKETKSLLNFSISSSEYCHRMVVSKDGKLCIFTNYDIYIISFHDRSEGDVVIKDILNLNLPCRYIAQSHDDRHHCFISLSNELYTFDLEDCSIEPAGSVKAGFDDNDYISGIVPANEGHYISLRTKGLFLLPKDSDTLVPTTIDYGVFTIMKDKRQPIIWVGTDSNGVICYSLEHAAFNCIPYDALPYDLQMPVRCICLDKSRNLWFGTKGEGLHRIRKFKTDGGNVINTTNTDQFTSENSNLTHDNVYSVIEGKSGIIWIGTEGNGLNWWSQQSGRIKKVRGSEKLLMVHSIIEQNESTLWVSTDEHGVHRCSWHMENGEAVIDEIHTLSLSAPFNDRSSFFSIAMQNDSTLWLGGLGEGALSYDINTGKSRTIQFPADYGLAINEVFHIATSGDTMLFATGSGLVAYNTKNDSTYFSEHVPSRATHAVVTNPKGNIWVSTNSGITSLDKNFNYISAYDRFSGMDVIEYSDGAGFYDQESGKVFFGGTNGITILDKCSKNIYDYSTYKPEINITNFIQNNESCHISQKMKKGYLKIPYSTSLFSIQFSVVDNLHYSDYQFRFQIKGLNDEWIDAHSNVIYVPKLDPGRYKLNLKYVNKSTSYESEVCSLPIYITPPLYRSVYAYVLYLILLAGLAYVTILYYKKRQQLMKERIHKKYSDEIMKIKSDTTGTITEELSVQITFILALCQQIKLHSQNNSFISDKVNLVEYNVAKINKMLNIFTEYKGISDTFSNSGEVTLIPVSQISTEVLDLMKTRVSDRQIVLTYDIEEEIVFAINKEAFLIVIYSLINKAISVATGQKTINISIKRIEEKGIVMTGSVTSERESYHGLKSAIRMNDKEDFELFVCKMIVDRMEGEMTCSYDEAESIISINIQLPSHKIENNSTTYIDTPVSEGIYTHNTIIENELSKREKPDSTLNYIYMASNNKDISSFMEYFLSEKYNVMVFNDNESLLEQMENNLPVAAIYDTSSIANGFPAFIEQIRSNRRTEQITIIALTSSIQVNEREECTKLGADLCISFPFNIDYLHSALETLLHKRQSIAEYYKSPMSTYVIDKGKIIHSDDKAFLDKIFKFIHENIANPDLTAPAIAKHLSTSTRVMYRRLESITDKKLHQVIKETRMQHATKLLTSSKLSIDEIMYRVGYDNRSTFYRNFKETYGVTPKEYRDNIRNNVMKSLEK